jgi:uncharacterized membrane protein
MDLTHCDLVGSGPLALSDYQQPCEADVRERGQAMMFYENGGWSPWMLASMVSGMLLFWGFVIWGGIVLFRGSRPGSRGPQLDSGQILNERLARREISTEEYERLRKLIGSTS